MGLLQYRQFLRVSILHFSHRPLQLRMFRHNANQLLLAFKRFLFGRKVARLNGLIIRLHLLHQRRRFSIFDSLGQFREQF